jgi:hypothetical protein
MSTNAESDSPQFKAKVALIDNAADIFDKIVVAMGKI